MEVSSIVQDHHAMAERALEKLLSFKPLAEKWFNEGTIDEMIKYIELNLVNDQGD